MIGKWNIKCKKHGFVINHHSRFHYIIIINASIDSDKVFANINFRFYFDFSSTYVGVGMICPYMVNVSLLIGAILSWGIMWPLIEQKKGSWYSAELPASSLHGIQGYRV